MTLVNEVTAEQLQDETWDCDDFWDVIDSQMLWGELDSYLNTIFPTGASIEAVNDLFRHEGGDVLEALGADLEGTIWDNDSDNDSDNEDDPYGEDTFADPEDA